MKLAFSTLACPGWSLDQVADAARRFGYEGVELRLIDGELIDPGMPAAERRRVATVLRRAGLQIAGVDSSIRLAAGDPAATSASLRAFLELAREWEAPLVRVFGGQPDQPAVEAAAARVSQILDDASDDAERLDVRIVLETHDAFSSAASVAAVLERVPSRSVGALWDTHHPHRMGESPARVLELLDGRILHVHVKDARRDGDGWQLVLLGEGEVPVQTALRSLREHGYSGWISVEWEKKWHPELPDPEIALPQHAELLRSWLDQRRS